MEQNFYKFMEGNIMIQFVLKPKPIEECDFSKSEYKNLSPMIHSLFGQLNVLEQVVKMLVANSSDKNEIIFYLKEILKSWQEVGYPNEFSHHMNLFLNSFEEKKQK